MMRNIQKLLIQPVQVCIYRTERIKIGWGGRSSQGSLIRRYVIVTNKVWVVNIFQNRRLSLNQIINRNTDIRFAVLQHRVIPNRSVLTTFWELTLISRLSREASSRSFLW